MEKRTLEERLNAAHKAAQANPSPERKRELEAMYNEGKAILSMDSAGNVSTRPKRWTYSPGGADDGVRKP